jgi:apolipoprotein D and lipocalin family protein
MAPEMTETASPRHLDGVIVTRWLSTAALVLGVAALSCANGGLPPLRATSQKVDLARFMGDWYVIAAIPIDLPFLSEANAYNAVESYRLTEDGRIATTYTFRDGAFDGPERRMQPTGVVYDTETNAEWRMQFFWPFTSAYLIVHVDEQYETTIIGVPDRSNVWVMARSPQLSEQRYDELMDLLKEAGYDMELVRRVPQEWTGVGQ